jgi:hypothetical protein
MDSNLITEAVNVVGLKKLATELGVTYQAIRKWEKAGRLPRTEWTGETNYSAKIEQLTDGAITRDGLLSMRKAA